MITGAKAAKTVITEGISAFKSLLVDNDAIKAATSILSLLYTYVSLPTNMVKNLIYMYGKRYKMTNKGATTFDGFDFELLQPTEVFRLQKNTFDKFNPWDK